MRKALSTACASVAGFHAGSTTITRSAPVRLRPTPPTLVVSSMQWNRSGCCWNLATFSARAAGSVFPSIRRQRRPLGLRQQIWMRSSILTLWLKTRVRWPRLASAGRSSARHRSLELCCSIASALRGSLRSMASAARPARASSSAAASWASSPASSAPRPHSCSSSAQAPGLAAGTSSSGWLQSRLSRPMARKTSTPSLLLAQASRMMSLFSRIFW
mmetsp:Transcript_6748/g.19969  ORF Transcript_6748/g.19969 Transcript_6748/m.19969 type:complete len:216 (-) Transcript_6748:1370-2017(-)